MKFQIEKIIIWPQNSNSPYREVKLYLGKVNVITGQSRTGKTAIIPIIDYCLASSSCSIPIEIIRDNASWYGIIICTQNEKILLARKVPDGIKVSSEFFVQRGFEIMVPYEIKESNQNEEGVLQLLDTIAGTPYIGREEQTGFNQRLSFRDLTHLIFQSQDVVANQNILFYKTHKTEHREKLRNWFPFILGAETVDSIINKQLVKNWESELKRKEKELSRAKKVSADWLQNLAGQLYKIKEYTGEKFEIPNSDNIDTLLTLSREILNKNIDFPSPSAEGLEKADDEIRTLEKREESLATAIAQTRKRINEIKKMTESFSDYQASTQQKIERLKLAEWLKQHSSEAAACPICGEKTHSAANFEIEKICASLERYEAVTSQAKNLPSALNRELVLLRKDLANFIEEQKKIKCRFDFIQAQKEENRQYLQKRNDLFLLLGQLKSTTELIDRLSIDSELNSEIEKLKDDIQKTKQLISKLNSVGLQKRALDIIAEKTLTHLKTLDVDEIYKAVAPHFSLKDLGIEVQGSDGMRHMLGEIGSASNWLSFHIAFTCALQEFFTEQKEPVSSVPSFIVYDQPSQVYFPKHNFDKEEDALLEDEDIRAARCIFETLANSIRKTHGAWQAIVLDHAGENVFGNIGGVELVEEWRNGQALIPVEWYQHDTK